MKLLKNNEIKRENWKGLNNISQFASPFQTPDFYDFYNSLEGFSADVFAVEENGELTSLVVISIQKEKGIKSYFSRRGIIYGGPIIRSDNNESLGFLLKSINRYYKKKLIYLETRNNFLYSIFTDSFKDAKWKYTPRVNVQLEINNRKIDDILKLMTYNRRREVKISLKEGALVSETNSEKETTQLYLILKELYETRVKLPLPSKEYFLAFLNSSIAKVFTVKHNDKIIGGAFCITDNETSINTLYYAGIREYHKKIFPTHLAIIGVIEYAISKHINMVDFMGAGKPNIPYGVRDFKLQFGGELVEHGRYIKILNPLLYNTGILGLKILSKVK